MIFFRKGWRLLVLVTLAGWLQENPTGIQPVSTVSAASPDQSSPVLQKDIREFVARHCIECHGEKKPKADLALQRYQDEASVIKDQKVWQHVIRMVEAGEMPPSRSPRPSSQEVASFLKSVRGLFERADRNAHADPGQVTVRRLNRVEYNNTIRDLVGVDFNPAKDFPADDIGHGFDNIGEVLSLSSVLLERYLVAAQSIVTRAIVVDPPATPPVKRVGAQQLGPTGPFIPPQRFRSIVSQPNKDAGLLFTPFALNQNFEALPLDPEQEYILRLRAYTKTTGKEPIRIALLGYGKNLKTAESDESLQQLESKTLDGLRPAAILKKFEAKGNSEATAETFEVKVSGRAGMQGVAVALFPPGAGSVTLAVEFLEWEGPLDPRPPTHRRLLACSPDKPRREQTREVLARFASRAYRRPVHSDELERLVRLVEAAETRGEKWEAGIQLAMQAVLVSPKFLFRIELDDPPDTPHPRPLDEYQLASRLSYFLWSSMPDEELFELAAKKQLVRNLEPQVRRMLQDSKAQALVDNFAMQWLQLRRLETVTPDTKRFPTFDEKLRSAMLQETKLFFAAIMREDRSILDLIDADFTFLNERLAKHYGIVDTNGKPIQGDQFQRIPLDGGERGGILTQASVLTTTSSPTRTSPVKRGRWILEQILGMPPPEPPADVPELAEDTKAAASGSLRQRLEQHRKNPVCASCHARMDPLGFALENFDAIGAFRTRDGKFPIDSSVTLPTGESFQGASELKVILKKKKDLFSRCLIEHMMTYALGRGLESYDQRAIDRISEALAANDYRFSVLVTGIVTSEPFRLRRGKDQDQ